MLFISYNWNNKRPPAVLALVFLAVSFQEFHNPVLDCVLTATMFAFHGVSECVSLRIYIGCDNKWL